MIQKLRNSGRLPFLILITVILGLSYGIGISKLSFYGDDWIYIYNYHIAGSESFAAFTQWDRPHSAWIYVITSALFKESPLGYHLYVLLMRWLSVFLFWKILKDTFGRSRATDAAAILFGIYPGFQQQPIAVEFVMHFSSLVLVMLSLWLMLKAYFSSGRKAVPLYLLSLGSGLLAIFTCEYFIGLELSRIFFLLIAIRNSKKQKTGAAARKTLLFYLPFLAGTVFYFIWRVFIFSFSTYAPKFLIAFRESPVGGIKLLISKVISDIVTVLFKAYRQIFSRPGYLSIPTALLIIAAAGLAVFLFFLTNHREKAPEPEKSGLKDNLLFLGTGVLLLLFSGLPYWGTFLDVSLSFPWDRSTLSFSPGAAMIVAVILDLAFKPVPFYAVTAVLAALSTIFHIQNTRIYINEADKMNDYFWQLAWRAPALEKGTILASEDIPLDRTSDNDLSPVVNWQYAPGNTGYSYDYKYFDLDLREGIYYSDPNTPIPVDHTYRSHSFTSSTAQTLGIYYRKNGCLQIIDRNNSNYPNLPDSLKHIASLSDPQLILTNSEVSAIPPMAIGSEPEHSYCYYFQKITLSQQSDDPATAYALAQETLNSNLKPVYAADLAPVILAMIEAGDFDSADRMIEGVSMSQTDSEYLCGYWMKNSTAETDENMKIFYKCHGCL